MKKLNKIVLDKIIEQYKLGLQIEEICEQNNCSPQSVYRIIKRHNIDLRDGRRGIKKKIDQFFFENIKTEKQAYWLGFFCADGYVNKNGQFDFKISLKDMVTKEIKVGDLVKYNGDCTAKIKDKIGICLKVYEGVFILVLFEKEKYRIMSKQFTKLGK